MAKIHTLELENVKRIKALSLDCSGRALTIIGGRNGQGKTSALDAIAWALGGDRFKPTNPNREGSVIPAKLRITLDNGLVVERSGKNGSLKVSDPSGRSGGQALIAQFISTFAIDLPKFLNSNNSDKAKTLLQIIGIGDELRKLDEQEKRLYDERTAHGRLADSRKKYADELPYYEGAPGEPVSVSDLIRQQQDILARNGANQQKRRNIEFIAGEVTRAQNTVNDLRSKLSDAESKLSGMKSDLETAQKTALELHDESTQEIEESLKNIEAINSKVSANNEKEKAIHEADAMAEQTKQLTEKIEAVRKAKIELLSSANLPLPELSVENGELVYKGKAWDCMAASEQLKVSTAIVRKLNPECGFVLMDKLEQMDVQTLREFGDWLESVGLQVIATRVSTGDECSVVIEDGMPIESETPKETPKFTPGTF